MAIILVRHGETAGNATRVVQPAATPLNEAGLRQADKLAARLAELGAAHLLSSDQPRALMTAEAIGRRTGLVPELAPLLQERNFGDLRGTPYADLPDGHPFGPDVSPPNGETWADFHARIQRAWQLVTERARQVDGNLVVVTHGLVVSYVLSSLVPKTPGLEVPAAFANASISMLDSAPPHAPTLINDVSFLGDEKSKTSYGAA